MKIFGMARTGQTATLNAVSTLLIVATCIFVALMTYMNRNHR